MQSELELESIADDSVKALYYSDPWLPGFIIGAQPYSKWLSSNHEISPQFPVYRTPLPGFATYAYNMYYSEAPLEDLVSIQACMDNGYCLGILLHYGNYSKTVGQYRCDREISDLYEPNCIGLLQVRHEGKPQIRLQVLDEISPQSEPADPILRLTHGILVWWHSKDVSSVSIVPIS